MAWLDAVPTVLLCGLLLVLPGLPITYLLGLRRLTAVALAPVVVTAVVVLTAVAASKLGIAWSPLLVLLVFAGLALVLGCVVVPLRRRLPPAAPGDSWPVVGASVAGLAGAVLLGALAVRLSIRGPEELVQTDDSSFHYNAIANILNTRDASTFMIDTLGVPGRAHGFYPAAWHDLGSLFVMISGSSVPAAANILSVTIALVVWPLGCVLLMRQLAGPSKLALGLAGLLSTAFGAFPWEMLGWGILWPNLLGLSLVPAALAALLSVTKLAKEDAIGRGRAWLLAPAFLVALTIAHPNAVISLAAIALPLVFLGFARASLRRYRAGRRLPAALLAAPIVLAAPVYWLVVVKSGVFAVTMSADAKPFESPSHAIGEALTGATNGRGAGWVLAVLVIVGAVSCFRQRSLRWLVAGHAISAGLYVLAAGVQWPGRRMFTGFWYTDSHRLAAMLPITGIPLAVIGVLAVIAAVRSWLSSASFLDQRRTLATRASAVVLPVVFLLLLLSTGGLNVLDHRNRVLSAYPKVDPLVNQEEYDLFKRIAERTEPGTIVAQMPYNGSPAVMALTRRQVLFPQLNIGRLTSDQIYLARHLNQAATDPRACAIADRLAVRYLLTNDIPRGNLWDGLAYPAPSAGFRQIDQGGTFKLYRVPLCDRAQPENR
ncbi:hypothetical protein QRX60_13995 [Amycolatopsis mongoliensis]|uniref:Uncharacterized protein n=1 Tax=Amycolatopsis mongoliensis TaxID=715475 RepID=A0A9Y2JWQ7_9PSEU|nr:DUF6541 family protein [Amycolatopsis sp. 4-36]WIY04897.1 hypothetical protein QRX60_13995 [Amycolatopsis sp. 4-36]